MTSVICAATLLINMSSIPWTDKDIEIKKRAEKFCEKNYKDAPCLTKFYKMEEGVYRAVCGKAK